jgi:hypothetical protein
MPVAAPTLSTVVHGRRVLVLRTASSATAATLTRLDRKGHAKSAQSVEKVRPSLHHPPTFIEILCMVVRRAALVTLIMRKLPFNRVRIPAQLIEQRRCHRAKPVTRHLIGRISQTPKACVDRVIRNRSLGGLQRRKQKATVASN